MGRLLKVQRRLAALKMALAGLSLDGSPLSAEGEPDMENPFSEMLNHTAKSSKTEEQMETAQMKLEDVKAKGRERFKQGRAIIPTWSLKDFHLTDSLVEALLQWRRGFD